MKGVELWSRYETDFAMRYRNWRITGVWESWDSAFGIPFRGGGLKSLY